MRYRYLIERGGSDVIYCTVIEANQDAPEIGTLGTFDNAADAKLAAEADAANSHNVIRWKDAPKAWQPYALYASQILDDGVVENRDA